MANRLEIYKCSICGIIVEVLNSGGGNLVCCGQEMELMKEQNTEMLHEKHVPVIEKTTGGIKVKVGSVPHPMEEGHYIQWIEIISDGVSERKFLKPGQKPEAEFCNIPENFIVREYCNVHGLWKS